MAVADNETPNLQTPMDTDRPSKGAPLWRFSLKGLFVLVTALCVLFALIGASGFGSSIGLILVAVLVAAHILGAVLGTRLRAAGSELADGKMSPDGEPDA